MLQIRKADSAELHAAFADMHDRFYEYEASLWGIMPIFALNI